MFLRELAAAHLRYSHLSLLTLDEIDSFIRYTRHLKTEILLHVTHSPTPTNAPETTPSPPFRLPQYIHEFLKNMMKWSDPQTIQAWDLLKSTVWEEGHCELTNSELSLFQYYGSKSYRSDERISPVMFYPPYRHCSNCRKHLNRMFRHPVVYYSAHKGSCAAYTTSLACSDCKIRYHPNYYMNDGMRCYYGGVPAIIQVDDHAFIDSELCELFTTLMSVAWVSSQNCANIFNIAFQGPHHQQPTTFPYTFSLSPQQVFRAFTINALLREWSERKMRLIIPDNGNNDTGLKEAMEVRNYMLIHEGQREKMHACQVCERFLPGNGCNGLSSLRAVVTDGILIGRPCCGVHNCTRPLNSNRHRFCPDHYDQHNLCVVTNCSDQSQDGYRTCSRPAHRVYEDYRTAKHKAWFQLTRRLRRLNLSQLPDSVDGIDVDDADDDEEAEDALAVVPTSDEGNSKVKVRFGRRRTHNEQLVVCCCGIIAARATMFGVEAISGVKDFLKSVYNFNSENVPDVIFSDNNCQLQAHLQKSKDSFFYHTILAVDAFHFKSKHRETDEFCQQHCNPALYKELYDEKGEWTFNSSAAEQANVWMGGYNAIVREMLPYCSDFFLDEMIKRRNERLVEKLWTSGKIPYHVPETRMPTEE